MKVNTLQLKRALRAILFVLLLSVAGKVFAEEEIVIGDGSMATNTYLPSYSYYKYSLTQQIYTAEEIGGSGYISRIAFYNDGAEKTRDYDIYMVNTVKEAFENNSDWIAVTEGDLVFSGTVTMFSGGWTWIEFDTPFLKGESNIVLVIDDNTGSYTDSPHMACRVFDTEGTQTIYQYSDGTNYNPYNPSGNGTLLSVKNQIKLGYESTTATTFSIAASASPSDGGMVTGSGTYGYYERCTLTATPNDGYIFTKWTLDGETITINPTYSFAVTENASYIANFVEESALVEIGDGDTTTNTYLPSYSYYKYALTQQIYTAEEIGGSGYISRIAFYNDGAEKTRDYDIYMVNTVKDAFENNSDWIAVTEGDLVFSGTVTMFSGGWTWIEFDTPFLKGVSNVAIVIDDNTGSYTGSPHMACRVFNTEVAQAIYKYNDGTNYNPYNPSSIEGTFLSVKNQIKLGYESTTATTYSIAASTSPSDGGTVTGVGNYEYYTQCTLTAIPNDGYVFVKWTDDAGNFISKETDYSFIVTSDSTFVAHFAEESSVCDITFDLNDSYGDGWNGNSLVVHFDDGSPQTLNLTITNGSSDFYTLPIINGSHVALSWISGDYIGECSFTVRYSNGNGIYHGNNLTSSFELGFDVDCEEMPATAFDITTMANMSEWGTVSGTGIYNQGQTCTLNATANYGYTFINWTKNGAVVSSDTIYSFAVTESGDYIAIFEQRSDMVFVGVGGTATNEYLPSYSYYNYTLSQQIYTADEIVVDGVIDKISFYNDGETKTRDYDIYMVSTDKISFDSVTDWIAVTPENLVYSGSVIMEAGTWTTIALDTPFDYDNSSNLALIIDDNSGNYTNSPHMACRVFDANGNQAIRIYSDGTNYDPYDPTSYNGTLHNVKNQIAFEFLDSNTPAYLITVSANPHAGGTVNGGGTYYYSHICTLTATPNEGYVFIKWTDETGVFVSNDAEYSFSVTSDSTFVAHFVEEGSVCDITFDLDDSYGDGWNGNNLVVHCEDGPTYMLTISSGLSASYTLPMVNGSHVALSWISGSWTNECSFTVRYSNGNGIYHGSNLNGDFEYGFDVDCEGMPATAFDITTMANMSEWGTVSGTGTYQQGQACTLTATAYQGYHFLNWTKNGAVVSTNATYSFIVTESAEYVAHFECDVLGDFTYYSPTNNYMFTSLPVSFSWDAVSGAKYYDLYLWDDEEQMPATPLASNLTYCHYSPSPLQNHHTYHWFVKAKNSCYEQSLDVKSFSLEITPSLHVNQTSIDYGEVALNGSASSSVSVSGIYLEDILNVQITGNDTDMFSVATASGWDDYNGGILIVTFNPTIQRFSYSANLVISSGTLTRTVTLSGFVSDVYVFSTHVAEDVYAMNSQIPIYGSLTGLNNVPVPDAEVEIGVFVMGMKRTLQAVTNENGQFSVVFEPMPSESGYYTVNSGRVGNHSTEVHDDFNIPGMAVATSGYNLCAVTQDQSRMDSILLWNKSNLPLNNIQLSVLSAPDGCSFSSSPMNLGGLEEDYLVYTVTGSTLTQGNNYEEVRLKATSDEGAETVITIWYYCMEPRGVLAVAPNAISNTMTKGKSKIIDVMLTNNGTGETGSIIVDLPNVEWMSVVGSDTLPSLAVHDTAYFSLRFSPSNNIQLVQYTGTIGINSERGDAVGLPYAITAVSDSTGTLVIDVTDDFTWNTNNGHGPHLEGAEVTLKGYYSLETVAHGYTDANGVFQVDNLPEGYYRLQVTADHHSQYSNNILVTAGEIYNEVIYLTYQAITYTWTVEPTEIPDEYTYELNVVYETNVPMPVITIEHSGFHELGYGESDNFNLIITNHGLISAFDTHIYFSESSEYTFAPLYDIIDTLPALSTIVVPGTYCRLSNRSGSGTDCDIHASSISRYLCYLESLIINSRSSAFDLGNEEICQPPYFLVVTPTPSNNNNGNGNSGGYNGGNNGGNGGGYVNGGSDVVDLPTPTSYEICNNCLDALIESAVSNSFPGPCFVTAVVSNVVAGTMLHHSSGNTAGKVLIDVVKCGAEIAIDYVAPGMGGPIVEAFSMYFTLRNCVKSDPYNPTQPRSSMDNIQNAIDGLYYSALYFSNELGFIKSFFQEEAWETEENTLEFLSQFEFQMDTVTGLVSESDAVELASSFVGTSVTYDDVLGFIHRWNRSIEYWSNNYYVVADLPVGYDTNFVQIDTVMFNYMNDIEHYFVSNGYEDMQEVYEESMEEAINLQENVSQSSVCASVKVKFSQNMTMTREAFDGTFTVHNGHDSEPMEAIGLDFIIKDEDGNVCNDLFQINTLSLNNLTGIDGSGSLGASLDGVAKIQFIPTKYAAPTEPKVYYFGGTFSFIDPYTLDEIVYDLYPVEITVNPSPDLYVDYFMQRDILGDDALTEDVVEPSVPAELGVIIHNQGAGMAKNVLLETAEPEIIDNEKGLAIDFAMYGASFNGSPRQLGLMEIPFGNIGSGQTAVGEWLFTSSLLGHFVSYEAHVIHNSSYGNSDLSLVSHLDIHELIHPIYAYGNLDDGINDFLVNDNPDAYDTPDSIYFSHGGKTSVGVVDGINCDHLVSPSDTIVTLTVEPSRIGWNYGVTDDPGMNQYNIVSCVRNNDNQVIPQNNVWQTFVTIPDGGDPVYENKLHIVDTIPVQQTTTYTLVFAKKPSNLRIFHGNEDEYWSNAANWEGNIIPKADDEVLINGICQLDEDVEVFSLTVAENQSLTIPEDRILTVSGQLTSASVSRLIIEEDGQLVHGNTGVQATVQKNILPYAEGENNGWYFIASPLAGSNSVTSVANMLNNDYDLYYYDEPTHYWINQEYAANNFAELVNGKGYLYANSDEVLLGFAGELQNGSSTVTVFLNYTEGGELQGFNLVGNPFVYNLTSYASVNVANGCYQLNEAKDDLIVNEVSEENPLKPAEGFFVKATDEGASITFNPGRGETRNHTGSIRVELLDHGKLIDRLIVKMDGEPLEKMSLKEQRTKVFATQNHQEIAIVPCAGNEQPINFKAAKDGTYTLNVNTNGLEFNYLHLIDNLTGADVDLLSPVGSPFVKGVGGFNEPWQATYTFEAKTTDYASRFRLVFSVCGDADGDNAPFAFINNGNIIIIGAEAGAVLQIVDVLGHVLVCRDASHVSTISTSGMAPGVYVLRLIQGENVRTQKIIIP